MNVQSVDLGDELRQGVEFRLDLAPVILCRPIARELLYGRELHALRRIRDRFSFRPLGGVDASAQFAKFRFRNVHMKRTNCICLLPASLCSTGLGHGASFSVVWDFLVCAAVETMVPSGRRRRQSASYSVFSIS